MMLRTEFPKGYSKSIFVTFLFFLVLSVLVPTETEVAYFRITICVLYCVVLVFLLIFLFLSLNKRIFKEDFGKYWFVREGRVRIAKVGYFYSYISLVKINKSEQVPLLGTMWCNLVHPYQTCYADFNKNKKITREIVQQFVEWCEEAPYYGGNELLKEYLQQSAQNINLPFEIKF